MKKHYCAVITGLLGVMSLQAGTPWHLLPTAGKPIQGARSLERAKGALKTPGGPLRLGENTPLEPPFVETFDNFRPGMEHDDFPRYFQVIDANNDNRVWGLYNYAEAVPYGRCAYLLHPIDAAKADDWLVTRAIKLQKGKYYYVCMDTKLYQEGEAHSFEVKYGMYNDPEGMNKMVIDRVEVTSERHKRVYGWICPTMTGLHYLGVHSNTTTKRGYLFVDNITVEAPREGGVPAEVSNLKLTNDPDGALAVHFEFDAPTQSLDGKALSALTKITVKRDEQVVATFDNPEPGQHLTLSDTVPAAGNYIYTVEVTNAVGTSAPSRVDHFAGLAAPVVPKITGLTEIGDNLVRLSWEPVTADVNGNVINPDKVTYSVYDVTSGEEMPLDMGISGTEYTYAPEIPADGQTLMMLMLRATINYNDSEGAVSERIAVGRPFPLPHRHSFTNDDLAKYPLGMTNEASGAMWRMLDDMSDPNSQDGDNGFISMIGDAPGQRCTLETAKIDLSQATHPMLSFYTYVYKGDQNKIHIWVKDIADGKQTEIKTVELAQFDRIGWTKVLVPMDAYAGKTVRIGIEGHIYTHGYIPVDNMTVADRPAVDLAVDALKLPGYTYPNEQFEAVAIIGNQGSQTVDSYIVKLLRDGEVVATAQAGPVEPLQQEAVLLYDELSVLSDPLSGYWVEVEAEGDGNADNNTSAPQSVSLLVTNYPVATNLTVSRQDSRVALNWNAPDLALAAPAETLEDFESYDNYATQFGPWTTVDADKGYVGGFDGEVIPGIAGTQQSWWVMEAKEPFSFIPTASGQKALAQMYGYSRDGRDIVACDDWLISPELYGGSQVLKFKAVSLSTDYGYDTFSVLTSTGGNAVDDFAELLPTTETDEDWREFIVVLPAGTRHFAIRCTSRNTFMMLLDDIKYTAKGEPQQLTLQGYNIYRNGTRLNEQPVESTAFTADLVDENDNYFVTAVYSAGESMASNVANLAALPAVGVDASSAPVYYDLQGRRIAPANLTPGIYIEHRGTTVRKIKL